MNFDISDSTRIANDKRVICDYYDCSIYFNQYASTRNNGGHIKIPFFTPKNIVKPNGIYISGEPIIKFMSSDLYIYKKTHNIAGINYDGELIIKNKQITNGDRKLYVCFPLKTDNRNSKQANEIDKIIDQSEKVNNDSFSMPVNLNNMFDKLQKYIFYKSGNDIIIVFTQPIKVKNNFDKFAECDLFPKYSDNYNILENVSGKDGFQSMTEGFIEGIDDGGMTCHPIDNSGEPLTDVPSLVKVNSGNEAQNKTINLLFAMLLFVVIFCFSFFGVPPLYKEIFITKLQDTTLTYTTLFCGFYLAWCIAMICGMIVDDTASTITGIFFLILLGMSFLTIFGRTYLDRTYVEDELAFKFDFNLVTDSGMYALNHIKEYFVNLSQDFPSNFFGTDKNRMAYSFGMITVILSFIFIILVAVKTIKTKSKDYACSMLGIFGLAYPFFLVSPFIKFIMTPS
jgi:DNA-binding cell septation regulator SpoVG